jgi:hypothetical protein
MMMAGQGARAAEKDVILKGSDAPGATTQWKQGDGYIQVSRGGFKSKKQYDNVHLHVEWQPPFPPGNLKGQKRGNSGVFMGKYEIQVLDNYKAPTYCTGQAGCIYGLYPPLVNACLPPDQWTTYDILFHNARYEGGKMTRPVRITALHNGVAIHHDVVLWGQFKWRDKLENRPHGPVNIELQNHGRPVRYRSLWVIPHEPDDDPERQAIDMARYRYQLSHQKWRMRDWKQPKPAVVTPGKEGAAPSDAKELGADGFKVPLKQKEGALIMSGKAVLKEAVPNSQFHFKWANAGPLTVSAFGCEIELPTRGKEWNTTDVLFSSGKEGGKGYVVLTAFHNGEFMEKRFAKEAGETTPVILSAAGAGYLAQAWIRPLGIYAGHDADRPLIDYSKKK